MAINEIFVTPHELDEMLILTNLKIDLKLLPYLDIIRKAINSVDSELPFGAKEYNIDDIQVNNFESTGDTNTLVDILLLFKTKNNTLETKGNAIHSKKESLKEDILINNFDINTLQNQLNNLQKQFDEFKDA